MSRRVRCPNTCWWIAPVRSHSTVDTTSSTLAGRSPPAVESVETVTYMELCTRAR
jgi:hypothetical protein